MFECPVIWYDDKSLSIIFDRVPRVSVRYALPSNTEEEIKDIKKYPFVNIKKLNVVLKDKEKNKTYKFEIPAYYKYDGSKANGKPDHKIKDRIKVDASLAYSPTDYQTIRFNMYNLLDRDDAISSYERYDLPFNWTLTYTHTF